MGGSRYVSVIQTKPVRPFVLSSRAEAATGARALRLANWRHPPHPPETEKERKNVHRDRDRDRARENFARISAELRRWFAFCSPEQHAYVRVHASVRIRSGRASGCTGGSGATGTHRPPLHKCSPRAMLSLRVPAWPATRPPE